MQIPLLVPGLLSAPQYENYDRLVVVRIPDSSCGCVSNKLNWAVNDVTTRQRARGEINRMKITADCLLQFSGRVHLDPE